MLGNGRVPKYRPRPDRDTAFVEMGGKRIPLPGRIGSKESLDAYNRLIGDYLQKQADEKTTTPRPPWDTTIGELVAAWLRWAKSYYLPTANTRSNEFSNCRDAVRPLIALFADLRITDFSPDHLKRYREAVASANWVPRKGKSPKPWSRGHINAQVNKIKRMFRWGATEVTMVPPEVAGVINLMAPLRPGRSAARETNPVEAVPDATVDAILPHISPVVSAMVQLQRLTGMRSDNLCTLCPRDIDRSGDVWIYRPAAHKTTHRGKLLAIPLGPKSQAILTPYLERPADLPCFSPKEAWRSRAGKRAPRTRYSASSYRRAIERACEAARVSQFHPHQLRHNAVQAAKRLRGLEGARAYVGHSRIATTAIYDERDLLAASEIAREIG